MDTAVDTNTKKFANPSLLSENSTLLFQCAVLVEGDV
jgi:hypothetical protein